MTRQFFGTDGVRGPVGQHPMTAEFALRLASAAAQVLVPAGGRVLIGKDTRLSGYLFEAALEAGFVAAGVDVELTGPIPTPAVAWLTAARGCDLGVVISASHNAFGDNGIKFFDRHGHKLPDAVERQIEALLGQPALTRSSEELGRASRVDAARRDYQAFCRSTFPADLTLAGERIVIDAANGAGYKVAPRVLAELGAEVIPIGCAPNGRNINDGCGSTHPALLTLTTTGVNARVGIALDGDGDRLVMADHRGRLVNGDGLLYVLARGLQASGELTGPVVGTVMSNLGLEQALARHGIGFVRAAVGDRYVIETMKETGAVLGGESSGHLLCRTKTTTGDGLVAALQVLATLQRFGRPLAEVVAEMPVYPQVLVNVQRATRLDLAGDGPWQAAVAAGEARLGASGRVLLRASGTEPVIRVMAEGEDGALVQDVVLSIAEVLRAMP